jgi:outer membrane protein assembly factor BamB
MEPLKAEDPVQLGQYRVHARLGAGGMGRVYLGFSPAGRAVALKVIHPELARDPAFRERFWREVTAARDVGGAYTAAVVGAGTDSDRPWLATTFVPGPSLQEIVTRHGPLPTPVVWRLAGGLVEALTAVHTCGLVHRDLTPANVLLATDGPRVIDFGLSRALEGMPLTMGGVVNGTPGFMSPEQAQGQAAGPASDVFSFGCVLVFAATGARPFGQGSPATLLFRIVHTEPGLAGLPRPLHEVAQWCLAKHPASRPSLAQLMGVIGAQPAAGGPGSPASFWPDEVTGLIRSYQARLEAAVPASMPWPPPETPAPLPPDAPGPVSDPEFSSQDLTPALAGHTRPAARGRHAQPAAGRRHARWQPAPARLLSRDLPPRAAYPGAALAQLPTITVPPADPAADDRRGEDCPRGAGPAVTRRQLLLGLTGAAAAGAAAGAWALARPGRGAGPGTQLWSYQTSGAVGSPALDGGGVYISSSSKLVAALRARDGSVRWTYRTSGPNTAGPAVAAGVVYAPSYDGNLYALSAGNGSVQWSYAAGGPVYGTPAVAADIVYTSSGRGDTHSGSMTAISAFDGAVLWQRDLRGIILYPPKVAAGVVYAGTTGGGLYALRASDGTVLWKAALASPLVGPVVAGDTVYTNSAASVYAFRAADGSPLWHHVISGQVSGVAVAAGVVYASSASGQVHALRASDGIVLWAHAAGSAVVFLPTVTGGTVYFGCRDGSVHALRASDGTPLWSYRTGGPVLSTPAVGSGAVYFGSNDGRVYALRTQ